MLLELINLNPDLKRLQEEGYEIHIEEGYLLIKNVPYVNEHKKIMRGTLVSKLNLAGNKTVKPNTHVVFFKGEYPCNKEGAPIMPIRYGMSSQTLTANLQVNYSFSNKPANGYKDYYEIVNRYVEIISAPAISLDITVTAKTFNIIESVDVESPFVYEDTNSSRSEITYISDNLKEQKIAIIGLGGTGSYILDLVAKTPIKEIHLFDGDTLLQHNAFRAPGAAPINMLQEKPKKVDYYYDIYSKMHKKIYCHDEYVDSQNVQLLENMDFVFICMDQGVAKKVIVDYLQAHNILFIDTGIGINIIDNQLFGSVRVTTSTVAKQDHVEKRVSFDNIDDDVYATNIQIADLNALNAILAVIKWKKLFGIYQDLEKEHNSIYSINVHSLVNDEQCIA